jgi:rRNA maturation protein Rpf1
MNKFARYKENKILSKNAKNYPYIRKKTKTSSNIPALHHLDQIAFTDKQKAEVFAEFFSTIFHPNPSLNYPIVEEGYFDYSLIFLTDFEIYMNYFGNCQLN